MKPKKLAIESEIEFDFYDPRDFIVGDRVIWLCKVKAMDRIKFIQSTVVALAVSKKVRVTTLDPDTDAYVSPNRLIRIRRA